MNFTPQQTALAEVEALYGRFKKGARRFGFTDDHLTYRRVGCRMGNVTLSAIGNTWREAIDGLKAKVAAA